MESWCLLGTEQLKVGVPDLAIDSFQKSYQISRRINGEEHVETANHLVNVANALQATGLMGEAINSYENASLILAKVE